jgi:hypothetical protein
MRHPYSFQYKTTLLTLACLMAACSQQPDQSPAPADPVKTDIRAPASKEMPPGQTGTSDPATPTTAAVQADIPVTEDPPALKALREGMPPDVSEFIRRAVICNHWAGEEPYDDDRREQINSAVKRMGCLELDADQKALRSRYASQGEVLKRISQSRKTPL